VSDEIPGGLSLEDDGPDPTPAPAAPVAETAAPADPQAPEAPAEPEVDAVEMGGQRYVPVAALQAERRERQALREQANRAVALEQQWREAQPYVEFLRNNPGLLQARQPDPVAATPSGPKEPDAAVVQLARSLDLYDAQGQPDLARAEQIRGLVRSEAQAIARETVEPMQQRSLREQADANFHRVKQTVKTPEGLQPSDDALRAVWEMVGYQDVSDPRVATVMGVLAHGFDAVRGTNKRPASVPVPPPALVTEASGGNPRTRPVLSPMEERIARDKGISATAWAEHTRGYVPGRPTTLED